MEKTLRAALSAHALLRHGADILASDGMRLERALPQHGTTSIYLHSFCVALVSLCWARRLRLRIDEAALVRGALLHDYFLYDWHKRGHGRLHGFRHPRIALENARRAFALRPVEEDVILRHMFPLNPHPPKYRESWLVCLADKYCATCETLRRPLVGDAMRRAVERQIASRA